MDNEQLKREIDQYIGETPLVKQEDRDRFRHWVQHGKKTTNLRKWMVSVIVSLAFLISAGAATAYIPVINNLVSQVSPDMALLLHPIEKSSVSKGIKMETVAAVNDDEMAIIYVTLQDLEKERIDSTLDLYDFSLSGTNMFNSRLVDYEDSTNTATLRIQANGGERLNNSKVNFRIDSFLSKKETHEFVEKDIFSRVKKQPETLPLDMNNMAGGGGELYRSLEAQGTINVLQPDTENTNLFETDFMEVTNIGMIDNKVHVQIRWKENYVDSHGRLTLKDESGRIFNSSNINFSIDETNHTTYGNEFTEYIFKPDEGPDSKLDLQGEFVTAGIYEEGNWSTTFELDSLEEITLEKKFEKTFGEWNSERVTVSPLGVTIYGEGSYKEGLTPNVEIRMVNGKEIKLESSKAKNKQGKVQLKFESNLPLDTSKIESIFINGTEVKMK